MNAFKYYKVIIINSLYSNTGLVAASHMVT
jgi:hypothetical protein